MIELKVQLKLTVGRPPSGFTGLITHAWITLSTTMMPRIPLSNPDTIFICS